MVVNGVGSVHKNLFTSWSVGYSFNTENFVINYNAADNTTASLARVESGAIDYLITDGRIEPANLPADALQVPVTGSALVMAINLDGINASSLVLPSPSPSFFFGFEEPECLTPANKNPHFAKLWCDSVELRIFSVICLAAGPETPLVTVWLGASRW